MKTPLLFFCFALCMLPSLLSGQSLQDQLNNAQPGDVIEFSGTEQGVFQTKGHGTASNPIIIRGLGSDAVIEGNGIGSGYGLQVKHNYYRLENFTIRNCKKGLYIENADHGVATSIHIEDIGQEAFKVKRNSNYWLFEDCSTKNTGLSGDYGEGFYVGDASSNWASSSQPDTPGYITFLNCTSIDPVNDGFDFKEGAHHIKVINGMVEWINVTPQSSHGNSGYYSRAEDLQYINCSSKGNGSGGPAFKHFQTDVNGVRYGYRVELKGLSIQDHSGDAIHFHRNDIAQTSVLYDDYSLQNVSGDLWYSSVAPIEPAANFQEMSWNGEGGELYLNSSPVAVSGVEVSPSALSVIEGQTSQVYATVSPSNASNKDISWTSDNTAVATVDAEGVVTGIAAGTAIITATTSDGGFTDYSEVSVNESGVGGDCQFGTPAASALQSIEAKYTYAHVLGSGPSMDNFKEFGIKWNLPNTGLYKFALNTTDGNPDYYVDLRPNLSYAFSSSQPDFTLNGSGVTGLDGEYWIAEHEGNIVWAEKSGAYTIYFSNSATPPCSAGSAMAANSRTSESSFGWETAAEMKLYPNPFRDRFTIQDDGLRKGDVLSIYNVSGMLVLQKTLNANKKQQIDLSSLEPGVYLLKTDASFRKPVRIIKE